MIRSVYEKLKPGGVFICISHGIPETRLNFLDLVSFYLLFLSNKERWSPDLRWAGEVYSTKLYKNKGKKSEMPFEETEI
jgi:hypothetical protein